MQRISPKWFWKTTFLLSAFWVVLGWVFFFLMAPSLFGINTVGLPDLRGASHTDAGVIMPGEWDQICLSSHIYCSGEKADYPELGPISEEDFSTLWAPDSRATFVVKEHKGIVTIQRLRHGEVVIGKEENILTCTRNRHARVDVSPTSGWPDFYALTPQFETTVVGCRGK
jgi:hypothetical protein